MYVCIYIYIYTYTSTYIYIYIYNCVRIYIERGYEGIIVNIQILKNTSCISPPVHCKIPSERNWNKALAKANTRQPKKSKYG